jgi:hypothetical protein
MLTSPPHLTKQEKIQAEWRLRFISNRRARTELVSKSNQKEWYKKRTEAELQIHKLLPHLGVFVERHWFESDEEGYRQYPMYALYHGKERLSPWYYRVEHLVHWATPNKYSLIAFISLKLNLHAQRPETEKFMRSIS